jgi:F0F1-type ATP synthase membrane subunit b/b'
MPSGMPPTRISAPNKVSVAPSLWLVWALLQGRPNMKTNKIDHPMIAEPAPAAEQPFHQAEEMREGAHMTGEQLKQKTAEAAEQLKQKGSETLHELRHQAEDMATRQKDTLLEKLRHCSHASRKAAEALREDNDPMMARYAEALAGQIDRGADYFRTQDYRGILHDTEDFARRHPEVFFGGLFVAGLALARFLKASSSGEHLERRMYGQESLQTASPVSQTVQDAERSVPAHMPTSPVNPSPANPPARPSVIEAPGSQVTG